MPDWADPDVLDGNAYQLMVVVRPRPGDRDGDLVVGDEGRPAATIDDR
jgi:hypothetical protein